MPRIDGETLIKWRDELDEILEDFESNEHMEVDDKLRRKILLTCHRVFREECAQIDINFGVSYAIDYAYSLAQLLATLEECANEILDDEGLVEMLDTVGKEVGYLHGHLSSTNTSMIPVRKLGKRGAKMVDSELRRLR